MPRLSIVIACRDDTDTFESTLASVLQHRPEDSEVIVVHPFTYADPYDLAGEVHFVDGGAASPLTDLLNAGLKAAGGDVIHFLEPGTQVEEGWVDAALRQFQASRVAAVTPLVLQVDDRQRLAYAGVRQGIAGSRQLNGVGCAVESNKFAPKSVGPSRHAGFYRTSVLRKLGGFDREVGDEAADLDLALTLRRLGFQCVLEVHSRLLGAVPDDYGRATFAAGRGHERVYWRHASQQRPVLAMLAHPAELVAEFAANVPRGGAVGALAGRLAACCERSGYRRFQQRMVRVQAQGPSGQEAAEEIEHGSPAGPRSLRNQAA